MKKTKHDWGKSVVKNSSGTPLAWVYEHKVNIVCDWHLISDTGPGKGTHPRGYALLIMPLTSVSSCWYDS